MRTKDFDLRARDLFGEVLVPMGFSCQKSTRCTFYREVRNEIFHFVIPDPGTKGIWFDVLIFASSPKIDPLFKARFPDDLGIPMDSFSYLNKYTGVGSEQQSFGCETQQQLDHVFAAEVKLLLINHGIPYIDRIRSIADALPLIKSKMYLGFALHYLGDYDKARLVMEVERARLEMMKQSNFGNRELEIVVDRLDHLLKN